ncbi:TPA: TRAP transporter substrate-binding protein, partial [Haemophilus influenzae]
LLQISLKTWNKIPKEDQIIFEKAAKLYQEKEWELAIKTELEVKDYLAKHGNEIIVPSEVFKNDMVNASKVLYDSFYKKYDWAKDVVQKINEAK